MKPATQNCVFTPIYDFLLDSYTLKNGAVWSGAEMHHFVHRLYFCKPIMASESFVHLGTCTGLF